MTTASLSKWFNEWQKPSSPNMLVMALEHPSLKKRKPPKKRRYTTRGSTGPGGKEKHNPTRPSIQISGGQFNSEKFQ